MKRVQINDGTRTWNCIEQNEEVTESGYIYMGTFPSTDIFDEKEYKVYTRKRDGVLVAVPGGVYG